MRDDLSSFLASGTRLCEGSVTWSDGTLPLRVTTYLGDNQPPVEYISSVRAIVFQDETAIVVNNHEGEKYILPGGTVEEDESPLETLNREVLEETGWTIRDTKLLGFMHFHHLGPKPEGYSYPHPDFIWPIYIAEVDDFHPEAIQSDDFVSSSYFTPIKEVEKMHLEDRGQSQLFGAALKLRQGDISLDSQPL